jgi:Spy/CpxP family protein refolding chaperone
MNARSAVRSVIMAVVFLSGMAVAQTPADRDGLLAGDAMGQAASAESNGYPIPQRLMQFSKELKLTPPQKAAMDALARDLKTRAADLGKRIVAVEEELGDAFKSGLVSERTIQETSDQIAKLRGRLRAFHLTAALKAKTLLTEEQLRAYGSLKSPAKAVTK